tara:strand:+ start:646 stop:2157 length:1512 start_codon:yes stop_codon:yes gene_type:complete
MPVLDEAIEAGIKQGTRHLAKRGAKKTAQALTWDDVVKGLNHVTQQELNVSQMTRNGQLLPEQVKVMQDEFTQNPQKGTEFLQEFEDGVLNDNWHNFQGHLGKSSQKYDQDIQRSRLDNGGGEQLEHTPDQDDLLPLGPWALKKGESESFVPDIDDNVSKSLMNATSQKDLIKSLRSPLYNQLAEHNVEITPEELVSSGMFDALVKRQGLLEEQVEVTKGYRAERDSLTAAGLNPKKDRPLKRAIKNFKTNNRSLRDLASLNLFTQTKDVFKINRDALKAQLDLFGKGKKEWHHTFFTNRQGGLAFLNKISQDPMIAANLMLKLKRLKVATSGTVDNLSLIDQLPHDELHNALRAKGIELGDLDIGEYMKEIGQAVSEGKADINEMFDILDVYAEVVVPYLRKQTEAAGPGFKNIKGFDETTKSYVSKTDETLGRNVKPKKSKTKQKVVPAPTGLQEVSPGVLASPRASKDPAVKAVMDKLAKDPTSLDSSGMGTRFNVNQMK